MYRYLCILNRHPGLKTKAHVTSSPNLHSYNWAVVTCPFIKVTRSPNYFQKMKIKNDPDGAGVAFLPLPTRSQAGGPDNFFKLYYRFRRIYS